MSGNIPFDISILVAFAIGLGFLLLMGKVLFIPLRLVTKLIINGVIGGIALYVINFVGSYIGLYVPINPVNALIVGFLGVPGVILVIILQQLI